MAKQNRTQWVCSACGHLSHKWMGRCPGCEQWNTLSEEIVRPEGPVRGVGLALSGQTPPLPINQVDTTDAPRFSSGSMELDRVLGGGIVPGSFVLVGGDPGIGKSTLLTHLAHRVALGQGRVLYISGEESTRQVRMRAERIGALAPGFYVAAETELAAIEAYVRGHKPQVVIVDSIQTMYRTEIPSAPGSVVQVRECAASLLRLAKSTGITIFIVGHVTKEGAIAGPRVLEHMVDTVLYFEGERHTRYRVLQAVKNRFGPLEIGVYEVGQQGLTDIPNASELFLSERPIGASGSVVVPVIEGTRPILVEVQALVGGSSYPYGKRTADGIDLNKLQLLIAVLEKRIGLSISSCDAFVKITGGVKINEPAVDLGLAAALASSFRDLPIDPTMVVIGEVGLAGEVRAVSHIEQRLKEAEKMGFQKAIVPQSALKGDGLNTGLKVFGASVLQDALNSAMGR